MTTPDQARATIDRYVDRHTAGDIDGILTCFAPDATAEDPVGTDAHVGTDALRAFFEGTHALCDRLELELTGPVRVALPWVALPMRAISHIGDDALVVDIIDVMTFDEDGLITEMKAYWSFDDTHPL
jgi:steroid delta-isomerase